MVKNIHLPTQNLTLEQQIAHLRLAHAVCHTWWSDKLDCRASFCRVRIEETFEEALQRFKESKFKHFSMIWRQSWFGKERPFLELGTRCTSLRDQNDYFLWAIVGEDEAIRLFGKTDREPHAESFFSARAM